VLLFLLQLCAIAVRAEDLNEPVDSVSPSADLATEPTWLETHIGVSYEAEFLGVDKSVVGRAVASVSLANNVANILNIQSNSTNYYVFSNTTVHAALKGTSKRSHERFEAPEGAMDTAGDLDSNVHNITRRQTTLPTQVYISVNTCLQPTFISTDVATSPPQLTLYVSSSTSNQYPGPDSTGPQTVVQLTEGYTMLSVLTNGDVYASVSAPQVAVADSSVWNYEVAASVETPYHYYNTSGPSLKLLDSDTRAGLLVTSGLEGLSSLLSSSWQASPPLSMFVTGFNDTSMAGLRQSYCAITHKANISAINIAPSSDGVQLGITTSQPGPAAEEQFYIPGLNRGSTYYGYLAMSGNSTNAGANVPGGGGTMFPLMNFTTKINSNCGLAFNLSFCSTIGYAVPANPSRYPNATELAAAYDASAESYMQNFTYSLQQIPCNTSPSAQYSLAKTCDDCRAAYKTWLCAVTIPRCFDFNDPPGADPRDYAYLQPRNVAQPPIEGSGIAPPTNETQLNWRATNTSRNADLIVDQIQPGPYREVLPCEDLCYNLIRSCPAALGFACPLKGKGLEESYGMKGTSLATGGGYTCSEPGAVYYQSVGVRGFLPGGSWWAFGLMFLWML